MKTLLVFNLGGGDLCFRIVDDFLFQHLHKSGRKIKPYEFPIDLTNQPNANTITRMRTKL